MESLGFQSCGLVVQNGDFLTKDSAQSIIGYSDLCVQSASLDLNGQFQCEADTDEKHTQKSKRQPFPAWPSWGVRNSTLPIMQLSTVFVGYGYKFEYDSDYH
jgi:hypothetical protein